MTNIEKFYSRTFSGASGTAVLQHLRQITIERILGQNATDSELRWHAAQCALVHQIENMVNRGKQ